MCAGLCIRGRKLRGGDDGEVERGRSGKNVQSIDI